MSYKFDLNDDLIFRLYESGLYDREVAKIIGVCPNTILNWRKRKELPANGKNAHIVHTKPSIERSIYCVWSTMIYRCENPQRRDFPHYGGRGISVCDEWHDFETFMDWAIKNGYDFGLELDRENNDNGYNPNNCRFVTHKINSRNRRSCKLLTIYEKTKSVSEWIEGTDICKFTVYAWIRDKGTSYAETRLKEKLSNVG